MNEKQIKKIVNEIILVKLLVGLVFITCTSPFWLLMLTGNASAFEMLTSVFGVVFSAGLALVCLMVLFNTGE